MYDVVNAPKGTGRRAKVPGLEVAAKTGTAEYGSRSNRRKHTWMIAFAPFDNPTIALAIVIEDGDSGGRTVAPLIRSALAYWFGLPDPGDEPVPEEPETPEDLEGQEAANQEPGTENQEPRTRSQES
jgi:membrane peptidoglycan carboxypeptidase